MCVNVPTYSSNCRNRHRHDRYTKHSSVRRTPAPVTVVVAPAQSLWNLSPSKDGMEWVVPALEVLNTCGTKKDDEAIYF